MKRYAFTLAEVLIVLGIIGIISALTIPTLIQKIQKQETLTALKKDYDVLSQAIKLSEIDNGPAKDWDWGDANNATFSAIDSFDMYWRPYLKVLKICNIASDCGYTSDIEKRLGYASYDVVRGENSLRLYSDTSRTLFSLTDGTIIHIVSQVGSNNDLAKRIYVDINGSKKPNKIGIDVFLFTISDKFAPWGITGEGYKCLDNSFYCARKIMEDGWEIKSNYPWK